MAQHIEVELNGVVVTALLLEDAAPKTVDALVKALPMSSKAIHCICSGECVWFQHDHVPIVEEENATTYFSQGDISLGYKHEFVIAYGRRCAARGFKGYMRFNVFAMVRDLDAMDRFAAVSAPIMSDGTGTISVRLKS